MQSKYSFQNGYKFGKWTVIGPTKYTYPNGRVCNGYNCQCECGKIQFMPPTYIFHQKSKQCRRCGIIQSYVTRPVETRKSYIDGRIHDPLYTAWCAMKARCSDPNHCSYKNYGARGIKICDEWLNFENFRKWAYSHGYSPGLQLDRIDNDGDYCPSNCKYVTRLENTNHRSSCVMITYKGITQSARDWDRQLGFKPDTVGQRINRFHWPVERALTEPVHTKTKRQS